MLRPHEGTRAAAEGDGEVDIVDAFADGALSPGWSAIVGGSIDIKYNFKDQKWYPKCVFIGNKDIDDALLEGVIGFAFDKYGKIIEVDMLKYYKNTIASDELLTPLVFAPIEYSKIITTEITNE